jgi:hypothetical protein
MDFAICFQRGALGSLSKKSSIRARKEVCERQEDKTLAII